MEKNKKVINVEQKALIITLIVFIVSSQFKQESRTTPVARKPRDAAAVLFGLKFADNIHRKFKSSQASKVRF